MSSAARQTSGPTSQAPPVHQGGSRGRVRHGNCAFDNYQDDQEASSHTYEEAEVVKRYETCTSADCTYPGGARRSAFCSFIRSHRSCMAACIAVLIAVGLARLTFINKERDQDDMRQLSITVDALKRGQDDIRQLSTIVDDLERDLGKEQNRTTVLEQRLHEIIMTPALCPYDYKTWNGICCKAFNTKKTFIDAAATCDEDGGTLAMPRDADTNAFLISLYKSVSDGRAFWFGLHDLREEGSYEWVDGSALGTYSSWEPGQPNNWADQDCIVSFASPYGKYKWGDFSCDHKYRFICQAVPGRP